MQTINSYSKKQKKTLGAFYSPQVLSDYLATTLLSYFNNNNKIINIVDPATGDSILLQSIIEQAKDFNDRINIFGLDVDKLAVRRSKEIFSSSGNRATIIETDALYPLKKHTPLNGWDSLKKKYFPEGIHCFVSNPPWGADITGYSNLHEDFKMASGQFDIYDLFIETIINNLNEQGYYGIIVPDSIYCQEHAPIRKKLLSETTIKEIVRLGEGFFTDVNMAVSLVFGQKKITPQSYNIKCSHLSNKEKKHVLTGKATLEEAIIQSQILVSSGMMIEYGYSFITDIDEKDIELFNIFSLCKKFSDFTISHRGVELSKRGAIVKCNNCGKWFPSPRWKKDSTTKCPHCSLPLTEGLPSKTIISNTIKGTSAPIIVGEDIFRYITIPTKRIALNCNGLNYKNNNLYKGTKILVRKTGVGITAGIDYKNCYVNQVVYILKKRSDVDISISPEVILAILNSRIMTYYFIKKAGSTGWKSNPYISQEMIKDLPFPDIDLSDNTTIKCLSQLNNLVKQGLNTNTHLFLSDKDAQIERIVAFLFGIEKRHYEIIFDTLKSVEQLIPFKRLLNITLEDIFHYGI